MTVQKSGSFARVPSLTFHSPTVKLIHECSRKQVRISS